ncbi:hypothetical protein BWR18_15260 [Tateyamaria omphalii]|uniref:Uncharacterized protein n=2 Tax=Tateyamaria omphalii TaxID=299262 RepID=A0A1P8MY32_9RHOB|nr:hypothetical protein BWR18_15260 [Tateyamaria omphalii]
MIARMSGAVMRGLLVALMIAIPGLVVPGVSMDASQATVLIALLAAIMTFIEYNARSPSIVEFRDAAPFNRLRFVALLTTVFLLSMICRGKTDPTLLTNALTSVGTIIGNSIDFPYSPVRLVVLMLPQDSHDSIVQSVRTAAGLSYLISLTAMAMFLFLVRVLGWPSRNGSFNVWVNLPLFDPTAGGDVLYRLNRDARINIALGFLLPFLIPAVVKMAADLLNPITLENPQTLIWTMSAWAFLPASMIMRGIAMQRIADMIKDQRKRAYANADADMLLA